MQTGLTAAQEAKLKTFVGDNGGDVTEEDIASFAVEFMTPAAIVHDFAKYFASQLDVTKKPVKAAKKAKPTGAAEAVQDASEPAGADDDSEAAGGADESFEPALFGDE